MKIILLSILFFVSLSLNAADRITATLTFTGGTTNAQTLVVNGNTRTYAASQSSSQIIANTNPGTSATNTFTQIAATPYAGPIRLYRLTATNIIYLEGAIGQSMTVTPGTYGTVSYSTQTVTLMTNISVPASGWPVPASATNAFSSLINAFAYATNPAMQFWPAFTNLVGTTNSQTVSNKTLTLSTVSVSTLTNATLYATNGTSSGLLITNSYLSATNGLLNTVTITNSHITNATSISGNAARITNGVFMTPILSAPKLTNGVNYGNAFSSPGANGTGAEQFGSGAVATNDAATALGYNSAARATNSTALGYNAVVLFDSPGGIAIGSSALVDSSPYGISIGNIADTTGYSNAVSIGYGAVANAVNQVRLGGTSSFASVPNDLLIGDILQLGDADSYLSFPTSMAKWVHIKNGTAPTAATTNAIAFGSVSGEWLYRASATSEGDATYNNRVHNRVYSVVGAGSDYSLTTSYAVLDFGGVDPSITLDTPGTFLIIATVRVTAGGTANDVYNFKLRDDDGPTDIGDTDTYDSSLGASLTRDITITGHYTVSTAGSIITIHGKNATAARGTVISTGTRIRVLRAH